MTNMEGSQQQAPQEQTPPAAEAQQHRQKHQRIELSEINPYLTCHLCRGYLIDATTISECLHSFCRSCIIKYLQENSHCAVCEVPINKAKPNLKLDKTLQDIVYKLVPELFLSEMCRRQMFYRKHPEQAVKVSPEQRGEDTERTIFNPRDTFSLSIEYISDDSTPGAILLPSNKTNVETNKKNGCKETTENMMRRFLQCPGMCRVDVLKKFVRNKYNVDTNRFHIDILYKRVPLPDHYTLIDIAYIYSWKRNEPMKFFFRITDIALVKERFDYLEPTINLEPAPPQSTQTGQVQKTVVAEEVITPKKILAYTSITLNRPSNTEIIAKIPNVTSKNRQPLVPNIMKQKKRNQALKNNEQKQNGLNKHHPEQIVKNEKKVTCSDDASVKVNVQNPDLNALTEKNKDKLSDNNSENNKVELISDKKDEKIELSEDSKAQPLSDNSSKKSVDTVVNSKIQVLSDNNHKKSIGMSENGKASVNEKKTEVLQSIRLIPTAPVAQNHGKNEKESIESQVKITNEETSQPLKESEKAQTARMEITRKDRLVDVKPKAQGKHQREALLLKIRQKSQEKSITKDVHSEKKNCEIQQKSQENPLIKVERIGEVKHKNKEKSLIKVVHAEESMREVQQKNQEKSVLKVKLSEEKIREKSVSPKQKPMVHAKASNSGSEVRKEISAVKDVKQLPSNSKGFKCPETSKNIPGNTNMHTKTTTVNLKQVQEKSPVHSNIEIDPAKEHFLKSIELTARNILPTIAHTQKKELQVKKVAVKRKTGSPIRAEKPAKRPKTEKKKPAKTSKSEKKAPVENLKTLLNTCKIPSSLSITCVNGDRETQIKPVINHIEILKLPEPKVEKMELDEKKQKAELEKVGTTMKPASSKDEDKPKETKEAKSELSITITTEKTEPTKPVGVHPNLPKMLPAAIPPRINPSFQKMFEETIKKPEFSEKIQKPLPKSSENNSGNKRNILEIASQLYNNKKTKLEHEMNEKLTFNKEGKIAIPRLNNQKSPRTPLNKSSDTKKEQIANLHSASLGMNFTVSVNPRGEACDTVKANSIQVAKPESYPAHRVLPAPYTQHSPRNVIHSPSPRSGGASPRPAHTSPRPAHVSPRPSHTSPRPSHTSPRPSHTSPRPSHTSPRPSQSTSPRNPPARSPSGQNLDPNQLLEKYNIQNLAQLTASFNFNPATMGNLTPANQLAAIHQAMLYKHLEMQNRQNWLSMNSNPIAQYEKYLQSLNASGQAAHLLSNIKEN